MPVENKSNGVIMMGKLYYRALLLFLLAIPFFTSNQFKEFHYEAEDFYFLFCAFVIGLSALIHLFILRRERMTVLVSWPDVWCAGLVLFILMRTMGTEGQRLTDLSFLKVIFLFLTYLWLRWLVAQDPGLKTWILQVSVVAGCAGALIGLLQAVGLLRNTNELYRIGGTFGNPGKYGAWLAVVFPAALSYWLENRNRRGMSVRGRLLLSVPGISIGAAILLSNARIAWIAMLVTTLLCLDGNFSFFPGWRRKFFRAGHYQWLAVPVVIIAGVSLLWLYRYKEPSSRGRVFIWRITGEIVRDHPLSGVGANQFERQYDLYQAAYFRDHPGDLRDAAVADDSNTAFNEYLQWLAEYGITGSALLVVVLLAFCLRLWRLRPGDVYLNSVTGVLAAYLILAIASYPFHIVSVNVYLIALLALGKWDHPRRTIRLCRRWLVLFCSGLLALYLLGGYQSWLDYSALQKWKKADVLANRLLFDEAGAAYGQAYKALARNPLFLLNYGNYLMSTGETGDAVRLFREASAFNSNSYLYDQLGLGYQRERAFDAAERAFVLAGNMNPGRFVPKYHLFLLYKEEGAWGKCLRLKQEVDRMPVKVPSVTIDNIKKDMQSTVDSFRAAVVPVSGMKRRSDSTYISVRKGYTGR